MGFETFCNGEKVKLQTVVSLRTEVFRRGNSFVLAKSITTLKRQSNFDILKEVISEDVEEILSIDGLNTLPDGKYELAYAHPTMDCETGNFEFDGFELIPYEAD